MTGTAMGEGEFLPEPRVVAQAALCATACYNSREAAKCFTGFEHLNFIKVISRTSHEQDGSPSRSRVGVLREAIKRKMGMHRELDSQRLLVASAQSDVERNEIEVYVAFRGSGVAGWVDIFDDADCSQTSLLGYGDIFDGAVKGLN